VLNHRPETHPLVRDLRHLLAAYEHNPVLVGEAYLFDPALVAEYYGNGDGVDLAFNFTAMHAPWDAAAWRDQIATAEATLGPQGAWPTWVLSNHDAPRHLTRYGGSPAIARAAAVLLVCLRGTPFLYAGEELGLTDAEVPPNRVVDPGGRDGCRAPVPWEAAPGHGWAGPEPWLPWPPEATVRNAEVATSNPGSLANLYRRVIALRRDIPALAAGDQELLDGPPGVVVLRRWPPAGAAGDAPVVVAVNFTGDEVALDAPALGATTVAVSSRDGAPLAASTFPGSLAPHEAVVLTP
jgi:alpha-glucosidase